MILPNRRSLVLLAALLPLIGATMTQADTTAGPVPADEWNFASIYGGSYSAKDFAGKAVLVVNTASLCGYTPQFADLQALQDAYQDKGLVVLAVPSDDFNQEKATNGEVKDFCEINYGITLPMSEIAHVRGPEAHPLFAWLRETTGFVPQWNFNKVLIDRRGHVAATFPSSAEPMGGEVEAAVRQALAAG